MDSIVVEWFLPFAFCQALIRRRQTAASQTHANTSNKETVHLAKVTLPSALNVSLRG